MLTYIFTQQALTVFVDNKVHTVHADDDRYPDAVKYVIAGDVDALTELLKPIETIREYLSTNQRVEIKGNAVYFDGNQIHNYTATRILDMHREGHPIEPLINFMVNVNDNPSKRAVDGLLEFLERGQLPITPDGCFLAYKRVRHDYMDCWTKTIDNSIGQTVEMSRNEVQDDPGITCSFGLHFCSLEYLGAFHGENIMVLKINPKDVVSIPSDYNMTKGRCCKYEVVGQLADLPETHNVWNSSLVDEYEEEIEDWMNDDLDSLDDELPTGVSFDDFLGLWKCALPWGGANFFSTREKAIEHFNEVNN